MQKKKVTKTLLIISCFVVGLLSMAAIGSDDFKAGKSMEIFYNVLRTVNLEYVDKVDNDKLLRKATDEMLTTLDPYTVYLDEKDMAQFKIATTGKYGGVGSLVKASKNGEYPSISTIYEGFPMHIAGVTPGDSIVSVDGVSTKGLSIGEVTDKMKGIPGTIVNMQMKKLRTNEIITYPVKREVVRISPIDYYGFVSDSVGYIYFNTFSTGGSKDVKRAVEDMKKGGKLKSLILDLRENGGGLVNEAVEIVSLFVPRGSEVVSMRGRDPREDRSYKTLSNPIDTSLKLAVLINRRSASASEIVAGALQDMDRAYIIGERSFGKGLVQAPRPVGYESFVKITIAKYYTPSGRCIQALDYSNRSEEGSVGHVPDSLISEFKSKGGRILYDGGGIMPDSVIVPDFLSLFSASVIARGYIEDFATDFYRRNIKVASVRDFKLTDKDYQDFCKMLADKEIEFESKNERLVDEIRKNAERERNLSMIKDELDAIERKLTTHDKAKSLKDHKEELIAILEPEIMSKYYFNTGRTEKMMLSDKQVKAAINVLKDSKHYKEVITTKSPRKN